MKKVLFLIVINLIIKTGFTQDYIPFADSTAIWNVRKSNGITHEIRDLRYGAYGDTIINTKKYKKIQFLYDTTLHHPLSKYVCAIREEDKRIFVKFPQIADEQLMYDFNLLIEDTIKYYYSGWVDDYIIPDTFYRYVYDIDTITLADGKPRKRFQFYGGTSRDTWIEGIGSIEWYGVFNPFVRISYDNGDQYEPTCVKVNNKLVFLDNSVCNSCFCSLYTSIIDFNSSETITLPSPNPFTNKIVFKFNDSKILKHVNIYDLNGKLIFKSEDFTYQQYEYNIDILEGTYIYEMIQDNKVVKIGKIIKTKQN